MEKFYENNNILYKILSCLLIAMYAVMCLYGSTVCAAGVSFPSNTQEIIDENPSFDYIIVTDYVGDTYFLLSPLAGNGSVQIRIIFNEYSTYSNKTSTYIDLFENQPILKYKLADNSWNKIDKMEYSSIFLSRVDGKTTLSDEEILNFKKNIHFIHYNSGSVPVAFSKVGIAEDIPFSSDGQRGTGDNNSGNTIGGGNTTGDSKDDESSDTSWLGSIRNWFSDLFDKIGNIANAVGEVISNIFSPLFDFIINILDWLNPFSENFILLRLWNFLADIVSFINPFSDNFLGKKIVSLIGDLLKSLFVPEDDYFTNKIDSLKTSLNDRIPYQQYLDDMDSLKNANNTRNNNDISTFVSLNNYTITDKLVINMNKFIDFGIFSKYKSTWFVWVRVVIYVLLLLYNINEFTKTLRGVGVINSAGKGYEEGKHANVGKHSA